MAIAVSSSMNNTSLGDRRIFVGTAVFVFVNIVIVLFAKIEDAVLDGQPPLHPFIRTFLKSCSLMIFLLKLAADFSWTDIYGYATRRSGDSSCESNPNSVFSYSALNQTDNYDEDADDELEDDGFDEVEHFSQDASWIPTSKSGEVSDSGSDRSANGSIDGIDLNTRSLRSGQTILTSSPKKRNKVRFSKYSEVRTLSSQEAHEALFSRLSYQASIRAEAEAVKLANRMKPFQTALLAVKLSVFCFVFQFCKESVLFTTELDFTPIILGVSCVSCLIYTFVQVSLYGHRVNSSTDTLGWSILLTVMSSLMSLCLVCLHISSLPSFSRLQYLHMECILMIISGLSLLMFVVILRKEVSDVDLLDIPLFLGLLGFFQSILFWPGFFFIPDVKVIFNASLTGMAAVLLGDILFLALVDLLWTWSTLTTSSLITIVSYMLRIPLTVLLSGRSDELTLIFWVGLIGLCFSLGSLVIFTNWTLIESHSHYSFWTSSKRSRGKSEEKECLTLNQES